MNRSNTRIYSVILFKKSPLMIIASILLITTVFFFVFTSFVFAHSRSEKVYASIEVEEGDTLLSIAREHMTSEYDNCYEYMEEIKRINHLGDSDLIHSDCYLIIPYYTDETGDL